MKTADPCCPISQFFELLGKKRVIFIIKSLIDGEHTFTSLKTKMFNVNSRILTERLDELEKKGYIVREVSTTKPLKIRYYLSDKGKSLGSKIKDMAQRAHQNCE